MPRKTDTIPLNSQFLNRRVKLLECQKERVFKMHHAESYGINQLGRMFKVDKRLIQFICYPERAERNRQLRAERGGSKRYYNKEKHVASIREHRQYKKQVLNSLINN